MQVNTLGPQLLAAACKKHDIKFMTFSSDLVFDGTKYHGYTEDDLVNPLNIYGKSKADAEVLVKIENLNALIIRSSAFFGLSDNFNFVHSVIECLRNNKPFSAADDICVSPTYVPDLVNTSLDLMIDDESGIWHLTNEGETTWAQLARTVANRARLDNDLIRPTPKRLMGYRAERPGYSVLKSNNGVLLPTLENALNRYFEGWLKVKTENAYVSW